MSNSDVSASGGEGPETPAEAGSAVARALRAHVGDGPPAPELVRAVERFARASRESGSLPEQVLVRLHEIIRGGTTSSARPSRRDEAPLRDRLIRLCIEAYYSDGTAGDQRTE